MVEKGNLWNEAGKAGMVLGLVSIAYMALSMLMQVDGKTAGLLMSILSGLLWAVKFIGCILLLRFFMKRFASRFPEVDNSDTFKFGSAAALLSAILFAGFNLAWLSFIQPDMLSGEMEAAMESMESMLTESQMEEVENLIPKLPTYMFFAQLIYCSLFGTMLAAIVSRNIPSANPFEK